MSSGFFTYVALILAPTWQWLLLAAGFQAITGALVGPSFDAFIAEHSSDENRARVFGISQAIFMIVGVVGPVLGGWLADSFGFKVMLMIAGGAYFVATILRVSMAREASKGSEAHPQVLSWGGLKSNLGTMFGLLISGGVVTWILITDGVRDTSFALSMNLFPLYMDQVGGLNLKQIGLMNSVFGLFMMLFTIPGGWLADKKGERVGIASGFLFVGTALGMLVYMPTSNIWLYMTGWAIAGLGVGLLTPAYQSLISKAVPKKVRGTAFGLFSTSLGLISLPAPWIGAQMWERVNPRLPFTITAIVSILTIIPTWLKFKLPKEANGNQAEEKIEK